MDFGITHSEKQRLTSAATPRIKVIGLGGAGSNAVDRMITVGMQGVEYIAANSDLQALRRSDATTKVQIGPSLTRGLGAGGKAEIGRGAALESEASLKEALSNADVVFIAAGMGGGTGTGAAPIAARIARGLGALVIGVVTVPFAFEGAHRARTAEAGLQALAKEVHTLVRVRNDRLLQITPRDLRIEVAFRVADDVLRQAIQGITELVGNTGLINLDFANVCAVIRRGGDSLMAIGHGETALQAAERALKCPLLDDGIAERATTLLIQLTGGPDMSLVDVNEAMINVSQAARPDADILFGAAEDLEMRGKVQVILIATGIAAPGHESIAVKSLFGAPVPAEDEYEASQEEPMLPEEAPKPSSLDVPAFMRRRELFGSLNA